jgi:hypothetical protein
MTWTAPHLTSEGHAAKAHLALKAGDEESARTYFAAAAEAEISAMRLLGPGTPRTYGILAVSAASLRVKAGQNEEALRIVEEAIAIPGLPGFARQQLADIRTVLDSAPGPCVVPD